MTIAGRGAALVLAACVWFAPTGAAALDLPRSVTNTSDAGKRAEFRGKPRQVRALRPLAPKLN